MHWPRFYGIVENLRCCGYWGDRVRGCEVIGFLWRGAGFGWHDLAFPSLVLRICPFLLRSICKQSGAAITLITDETFAYGEFKIKYIRSVKVFQAKNGANATYVISSDSFYVFGNGQ